MNKYKVYFKDKTIMEIVASSTRESADNNSIIFYTTQDNSVDIKVAEFNRNSLIGYVVSDSLVNNEFNSNMDCDWIRRTSGQVPNEGEKVLIAILRDKDTQEFTYDVAVYEKNVFQACLGGLDLKDIEAWIPFPKYWDDPFN